MRISHGEQEHEEFHPRNPRIQDGECGAAAGERDPAAALRDQVIKDLRCRFRGECVSHSGHSYNLGGSGQGADRWRELGSGRGSGVEGLGSGEEEGLGSGGEEGRRG